MESLSKKKIRNLIYEDIIKYINYQVYLSVKDSKTMNNRGYRDGIYNMSIGYVDFAYNHNLIYKKDRLYFIDRLFNFVWYY